MKQNKSSSQDCEIWSVAVAPVLVRVGHMVLREVVVVSIKKLIIGGGYGARRGGGGGGGYGYGAGR